MRLGDHRAEVTQLWPFRLRFTLPNFGHPFMSALRPGVRPRKSKKWDEAAVPDRVSKCRLLTRADIYSLGIVIGECFQIEKPVAP